MRKPLHKHEKDPAGLARPRRPLATCAPLSRGRSFAAHVMPGLVASAELKHACGCDLSLHERWSDTLQALISTGFMVWTPCASVPA